MEIVVSMGNNGDVMDEQILFTAREELRNWLSENHNAGKGIWLVFGKAGKLKAFKADEEVWKI